ncbi:MAG: hypothetical protein P4M10_03715, partial [Verrucomicrobiae bacterium]|nr:hypothetical protein [Verrucomicrobiae bacterium]
MGSISSNNEAVKQRKIRWKTLFFVIFAFFCGYEFCGNAVSNLRQSRRLDEGGAAQGRMALRASIPPLQFQQTVAALPLQKIF